MWKIFGFLVFGICHIFASADDEASNTTLKTIENLFKTVDLVNIVPALIQNASQPDQYLTAPELIQKYGYPVEIHTVTTGDGYILQMHRIPYSNKSPAAPNKPVVFLQHGLLSSSVDWIILGPEKSLGYLLADAGYDVWMGNARGNTYSVKHTSLTTSDPKFWDFSWHEMGVYDLPAALDYVLANTTQNDLYYVGHSMGTTMFYVLTSSMPQYNAKIRLMTGLAPIAFMTYVTSPFSKLLAWNPLIYPVGHLLGLKQFLPSGSLMTSIANSICSEKDIAQQVCSTILFAIGGFDQAQLNMTLLPVLFSHGPAGSSVKCLLHYAQEMTSGHFRQYDYGLISNKIKYGQFSPPDYRLSEISAPVFLMYGDNDWFGDPDDVKTLNKSLPHSVELFRVNFSSFNHFDFLWANDVKPLVNDKVMEVIKNF